MPGSQEVLNKSWGMAQGGSRGIYCRCYRTLGTVITEVCIVVVAIVGVIVAIVVVDGVVTLL